MPPGAPHLPSRHAVLAREIRPFLERRAADLGVPFASETHTADLALLVLSEEQRDVRRMPELPGCFGLVWMAPLRVRDSAPECRTCQIQTACLQRFAFHTVRDAAQTCFSYSPASIGEYLSVSWRAVAYGQAWWHLMSGHVPQSALSAAEAAAKQDAKATLEADLPQPALLVVDSHERRNAALQAARQPSLPGSNLEQRRRRRMADVVRRELQRANSSEGHWRFVRAALDRAPRKVPSLGRDDNEVCRVLPESTFYSRWMRERQRSPLLAQLRPGVVLNRKFRGINYVVKVHHGYYTIGDVKYATLYSVTKAIAGAKRFLRPPGPDGKRAQGTRSMCSHSAARFFAREIRKRLEAF